MASLQGIVGAQNNADSGNVLVTARLGKQGDISVSELHGRYYEQAYRGNAFYAASQAVATTTVGLATTYTGLSLSNPLASGVNLVLLQGSLMQSVIQATQVEAYAIATGFSATTNVTHTAALATHPSLVGSARTSLGLADTSATLPTAPFYTMFVTDTAAASTDSPGVVVDVAGSIILAPGAYACWVTPAQASVAGLWFSFTWEEVPV